MAQDITVGDFLKVTYAARGFGQNGLCTRLFQVIEKGAGPVSDLDVVQALEANCKAAWKAWLNENTYFYGVRVQLFHLNAGFLPQTVISTASQGTNPGSPLPSQVACLLSHKTALAGRQYRGRNYLPFLSQPDVDDNGMFVQNCLDAAALLATKCFDRYTGTTGGTLWKIDPVLQPKMAVPPQVIVKTIVRNAPSQMRTRSQLRHGDQLPW